MELNLKTVSTPPAPRTILVIDDEPTIRESLTFVLNSAGYVTLCASDGKQAISILRARRVHLVLLDVTMPGMDGLTFLKYLRSESATRTVPVIMLTGADSKREVLEAARYGVQAYLVKSRFSLKELLARVRQHIGAGPAPGDVAA